MQTKTIWQIKTELYVYGLKWRLTTTILKLVPRNFSRVSPLLFLFIKLRDSNTYLKCALVCLQHDDNCQKDVRAVLESLDVHCRCSHTQTESSSLISKLGW